ncbi:MAG: Mth938-like domain-containing protein [Steroidobacteraceae bacterium]
MLTVSTLSKTVRFPSTAVTGAALVRYGTRMKFNLDPPGGRLLVRAWTPGEIRIGDRAWTRSVLLGHDGTVAEWRPSCIEDLVEADLDAVLALGPEVILIGSGTRQRFPDRARLAPLYAARVGFEIMDSGAACRTYNLLAAEGRNVAAALIVEAAR